VVKDGTLYAGATVVDAALTAAWMVVNVAVPRLFRRRLPAGSPKPTTSAQTSGVEADREAVNPLELGLVIALAAFSVWASDIVSARLEQALGFAVPSMLVLTTLALVLAQLPIIARLRGTRLCGMFAVMLFLAVIGALCDVRALVEIGPLGLRLLIFASILLAVHGAVVYGAAAALRLDPVVASVASQANVGGGTSALAIARSLGRPDLVLPAILIGSVGTSLGTYLGFWTAAWLR